MTNARVLAQSASNNTTFRNRIINGAMAIDQRNAGGAVTFASGYAYPVDRFRSYTNLVTGRYTVQQVADAPSGFVYSSKVTVTTTQSSLGASELSQLFEQPIEGYNIADLDWGLSTAKPVTLSFWVKSSVTGAFAVGFFNVSFTRSYITTYTVNTANTWEYKTITVPGPTSGVWNTVNSTGTYVAFNMAAGSTYTTSTTNTWLNGQYFGATGTVNLCATSGATWQFTGVQFEKGTSATPFEQRLYGTELALCERYLEYSAGGGYFNNSPNGSFWGVVCNYRQKKRASPTVTLANNVALANNIGSPYSEAISVDGFRAMCQASGNNVNWQSTYKSECEL